ncbi:MAG TPA: hypothetical protein VF595_01160 [Tepidisphaeraceae bacterium]|jgi:hypothetical protein
MPAPDPIQLSLLLLLAAAVVLYVGSRLLWVAVPWPGLWRGVVMSGPAVALALYHAPHAPGTAIALVVSAAVLALTLGMGVGTIDLPVTEADGSPVLRTLLPLVATVCLCGFRGTLGWYELAALTIVGGLTLWTAAGERRTVPAASPVLLAVPAVLICGIGLTLLILATRQFRQGNPSGAFTPVVVLLTVPALFLALLGLLSAEAREHRPDTPQETAAGLAIACLGVGLPAVVAVALVTRLLAGPLPTLPRAATQPSLNDVYVVAEPVLGPIVVPLVTWRVDSVLLVVVSVLLLPIGAGRFKFGRAEGAWLILIYLAYAAVATRTGTTAG